MLIRFKIEYILQMQIININIRQWRHFENIEFDIDKDTNVVCLVGANGTGKSHILELIAACAERLSITRGIDIPRGSPFSDPHDISLTFYINNHVSENVEEQLQSLDGFAQWDRTIVVQHSNIPPLNIDKIKAGGFENDRDGQNFAQQVKNILHRSNDVHFLSLDANRAYPKQQLNVNHMAQAYEIDWKGVEYTKGRSFRSTHTLYDEWIKYFLAIENEIGTQLTQELRRSKKSGEPAPEFMDPFEVYATTLQEVLPHIQFIGVDSKSRTIMFDTTGLELSFDKLSGGEREIAFLIGQIDRFGLRNGLFLLDEPELHLNADLIRSWVSYLNGTIETGQIWLATHSLEAVEAVGQHATFVLERDNESRKVNTVERLDNRPVLSALSRAVGTPAFSVSQLAFIFIEGEESVGERERFRNLAGNSDHIRFIESGSCKEVSRRVGAVRSLINEVEEEIRIGGIVDRDFLTQDDIQRLRDESNIYVLQVHEVENFFLHPATLQTLLTQNGIADVIPETIIQQKADRRAGAWIFQYLMSLSYAKKLSPIPEAAKEYIKNLTWEQLISEHDDPFEEVITLSGFQDPIQTRFRRLLTSSKRNYERKRTENSFWKICEGKQVLQEISSSVGYTNSSTLIRACFVVWSQEDAELSDELLNFREYLSSL